LQLGAWIPFTIKADDRGEKKTLETQRDTGIMGGQNNREGKWGKRAMLTRGNGFSFPWRLPVRFDGEASFALCALFITLLLTYSNSFQGDWHFDDFHNIVENRCVHLTGLTTGDLSRSFYGLTCDTEEPRISRPLAYASLALNYLADGTQVFGYHLVNFVIHFAAAYFVFLLVRLTLSLPAMRERYGSVAYPVALLSSFLWATSPLHVHAVTIIVQRMASLAGLGYVMSLYFYARARTGESARCRLTLFPLSAICALAAFATKENTAVLPIALLLYDLFFIQGITKGSAKRTLQWSVIPLVVVIGLGLLYTDFSAVRDTYDAGVRPFSPVERLLTQGRVLFLYVSLLLYPIPSRLMFLHDIDISHGLLEPWTTAASIVGIALCLLFAVAKAKKYPLLSFAVLFFFLNHLVEGTVIPLELIFEHRNYIPSMFFFVPVAVLMIRCLDYFSYHRGIQYFMAAGFAMLLAFQGHTTFERNGIVRSDLHLWLDNVRKAPGLSRPHINLARHYYEAGMYEEAYREWKTAEDLNRDTNLQQIGLASYNLGVYYLYQAKDIERAEKQFIKAMERFPGHPSAVAGLATAYLTRGDIEKAWALMKEHGPRFRNDVEILNCYALVLLKKGKAQGALKTAARTMSLKWNDPQPWEISGEAWRRLGQWQKAAACWEEALRLNPSSQRAYVALVEIYDRLKNSPALSRMVARCLVLKGEMRLDDWLASLAGNNGVSVYEVNPGMLSRIIRREIHREFGQKK
jgi:protein O-mannosyl-transferase